MGGKKMTRCFALAVALSVALIYSASALADSATNPPGGNLPGQFLTTQEILLSGFVILFGISVVTVEYLMLKPVIQEGNLSEVFRIFTVTLIIIGTLLLITAGFSTQQVAPALGLF